MNIDLTPEQSRLLFDLVNKTVRNKRFNDDKKLKEWLAVWYPIQDAVRTAHYDNRRDK